MRTKVLVHSKAPAKLKRKGKSKQYELKNRQRIVQQNFEKFCMEKVDEQTPTEVSSVLSCRISPSKGSENSLTSLEYAEDQIVAATNKLPERKKKFIKLYDPVKRKRKCFKLFREQDLPMSLCKGQKKVLKDPLCDDDCATENEQIESSARKINKELKNALHEYLNDECEVTNIAKYR